ncbi:hypothetical protein [Deinococcus sp. Marseille-Q6407]|uniref:hypothetical protein n=1 Tax=Deinococcus sp. Marseille-Q6407 TaxID=2969223 RepID=UPI0021C14CF5|nr:hypothetical protein [Deinococcus sp. Marseille-Q6407]
MRSNLRKVHGWHRHLLLLSDWAWVRRLIGGKWECYILPSGHDVAWYPVGFFAGGQVRPHAGCMGRGIREDYTPRPCAECGARPAAVPAELCWQCSGWA